MNFHLKPRMKRLYSADFDPEKIMFLEETSRRKLTIIFLMVSGRPCQKPAKVVLREPDFETWDHTMNFFAKILDLPDGILYICTIFGDILQYSNEVQHGYVYVAVPFGQKFRYMDYMTIFARTGIR